MTEEATEKAAPPPPTMHGVAEPRGLDYVPRSSSYQGRFGRLFRKLPPCPEYDDTTLEELANLMREVAAPSGWNSATPVQDGDNEAIPAGYTYLGQFIDHDITFDPVSNLTRVNDPTPASSRPGSSAKRPRDTIQPQERPGSCSSKVSTTTYFEPSSSFGRRGRSSKCGS